MGRKVLVLLISGIVGFLAITGCTKKEEVGGIKEGRIVLRYANASHKAYNKFRETEAKKFEKFYPSVVVKYEAIAARGYWTKIMTMIAGGTAADVFRNDDVMSLARKGAILDLTPYMEKDKEYFDEIYPELIDFHRYEGKIYGLPSNLNVDILFYNKELFDKAGLSYPDESWTWDTMLEAARRLTKRDSRGFTIQFGVTNLHPRILELFRQNGGSVWNEAKTKCIINSPENAEALRFYKDLAYRYHVSPTPSEMQTQDNVEMFIVGKVGMVYGGNWLTALFKLKKDLRWGVAPLPRKKNRDSWSNFITLSVSSATKHPELAYELAKFLTRPEAIKFLVDVGDSIPIRWSKEATDYFYREPENQVYLDTMKYVCTNKWSFHPDIPYQMQRMTIAQELERFTVSGEITAETALQSIENGLNKLLEESPRR